MWSLPEPGDIVWCNFPELPRDNPGPKPRPALVLAVTEYDGGATVMVAYGTSKKISDMRQGQFAIRKLDSKVAYETAGLAYDTKFDLCNRVELAWNSRFFGVPPRPAFGQTPKLGSLHISMMRALEAAAKACF